MIRYILKIPTFQQWLAGYEDTFDDELMKWMQKSGKQTKNGKPVILPDGFDEYILAQYTAYRTEVATRRLVQATWILAISTIILSIITIFIK